MRGFFLVISILLFHAVSAQEFITVGSYNIKGFENPSGLKKDLSSLSQVQVWAFQEVNVSEKENALNKISAILPATGSWYIYFQPVNLIDAKKRIWEGQAIASRFPILKAEVLTLNRTGKKTRVALVAQIENIPFLFINTDHEVDIFKVGFNDRKKQIFSLLDYSQSRAEKILITGDFNSSGDPWSWDNYDEVQKTQKLFEQHGYQMVGSEETDSYTFKSGVITTHIDHMFVLGPKTNKWKKLKDRIGSDHFPIYVEVLK